MPIARLVHRRTVLFGTAAVAVGGIFRPPSASAGLRSSPQGGGATEAASPITPTPTPAGSGGHVHLLGVL
ncbi:MAG: hypothetical protein L0G22_01275 [Propionibacteriaceae bacterium]|nr:hypothetical protein [Propionibacteriaceae bacterium]